MRTCTPWWSAANAISLIIVWKEGLFFFRVARIIQSASSCQHWGVSRRTDDVEMTRGCAHTCIAFRVANEVYGHRQDVFISMFFPWLLILPTLSSPSTSLWHQADPLRPTPLNVVPSSVYPKVCSKVIQACEICLLKEGGERVYNPFTLLQDFFLPLSCQLFFHSSVPCIFGSTAQTQLHYGYHVEYHTGQVQEYVRAFYWTVRYIMVCFPPSQRTSNYW
jgi:hypothetical protein